MRQATMSRDAGAGTLGEDARAVAQGLRRDSIAPGAVGAAAMALDAAALALGVWFAAFAGAGPAFDAWRAAAIAFCVAGAACAAASALGAYRLPALRRLLRGAALLLALALALALCVGLWPAALAALPAFVLPARALGAALAAAAADFGLTERRAVLVGGGARAARVLGAISQTPGAGIRVCGLFDDRDDARSPPVVRGVPKLGTLAALVDFVRAAEIELLIVALPLDADRRIRQILTAFDVLPVDIRLADCGATDDEEPLAAPRLVDLMSRPLRRRDRALKRALDLVGASLALVLLAPLMLGTALAIRLDSPGPALFRQPRHGYNHRPVTVWKFRSMRADACDPTARRVVTKGDPRVTRVGRLIRRLSIDELPQLFNVLAGDLSLVGPRPHAIGAVSSRQEAFEDLVDRYAARHKVRPGVTGLAQINGWRGEIDAPEALRARVACDLAYIGNWSIWLDLRILALTPLRLLNPQGAY